MQRDRSKPIQRGVPFLIALLGFAVLAPTFDAGWFGDDAFYSNLNGALAVHHQSLGDAIGNAFRLWFWGNGRIYPLAILEKYVVFSLFTPLVAYKFFLITLTLVAVEVFRRTVSAYTNTGFANLCALAAVTLLQQRGYHDATLAYNGTLQLVAITFFSALLSLRRSIVTGSAAAAWFGVVLFAAAALLYEAAYPLALVFVVAASAVANSRRDAVARSVPYLVVGAGLAIASALLRSVRHLAPDSPYRFAGDPRAVLSTALDQISAAFPLSYWFFDPSGIFGRSSLYDFLNNAPLQPFLFAAFAAVAWFVLAETELAPRCVSPMVLAGIGLAVLPALSLAAVAKYQGELRAGLGYLPVFLQLFGVALLGGVVATSLVRRFASRITIGLLCMAIALCGTMTAATNARVGRELLPATVARDRLERALDAGLLKKVPDGSQVAFAQPFDFVTPDGAGPDGISTEGLFYTHGGKRFTVVSVRSGGRPAAFLLYDPASRSWSVSTVGKGRNSR